VVFQTISQKPQLDVVIVDAERAAEVEVALGLDQPLAQRDLQRGRHRLQGS
jgi:hypothetical protein